MLDALQEWQVLPHGRLTRLDDNVLTVTGEIRVPEGSLSRRMTVVRLRDRRLIIFSAIALDEEQMRELEAFGTPAYLIVPNDHHRMDARIWKDRYPDLRVITPRGAQRKVGEVVPVDAVNVQFPDPDVRLEMVRGMQDEEAALRVHSRRGTTLVLSDVISGIGEPHVPQPVRATVVDSRGALRDQLLDWARLPGLQRIVVSHGPVIEQDAPAALRRVAASLQ